MPTETERSQETERRTERTPGREVNVDVEKERLTETGRPAEQGEPEASNDSGETADKQSK